MTTTGETKRDSADSGTDAAGNTGPRRLRKAERKRLALAVVVIAAIGGVILAESAATDVAAADAVLRCIFAGGLAYLGSRSRRVPLLVGSFIVVIAANGELPVLRAGALAVSMILAALNIRSRTFGAAVGGAVAICAMHLDVGYFGALGNTLVAAAATAPIAYSGYLRLHLTARSRIVRGTVVAFACVAVLGILFAVQTFRAYPSLRSAVSEATAAVEASRAGDGDEAQEKFSSASLQFSDASDLLGNPVMSIGRVLPVVGVNIGAVQETVELGAQLGETSRVIAADVDFDSLAAGGGGLDLDRLATYAQPVDAANDVLDRLDVFLDRATSPWLAPPIRSRLDDLGAEVSDLSQQTDVAALGVRDGPAIMGADETRRYLLLLGNPAESRDVGGHIGNWAELEVTDGKFTLNEVGSPLDLRPPPGSVTPEAIESLEDRYPPKLVEMKPLQFPQNWGSHPDFRQVAVLSDELYSAATGRDLDGLIYADAEVFAALLDLTGPIRVANESQNLELTTDNASEFLLKEQFAAFATEADASTALEATIETLFDELIELPFPSPERVSGLLWPMAQEGRLRMVTFHDEDRELLDRFGLTGALPAVDGGDVLGVFTRNAGPSKIDAYLTTDVAARIQWNPDTGDVRSVVTATLQNDAPANANPLAVGNAAGQPSGTNISDVSVLTPFRLKSILVNGISRATRPLQEGELWRHSVRVAIPPGELMEVNFHLEGTVEPGNVYSLTRVRQPTAIPRTFSVEAEPRGAAAAGDVTLLVKQGSEIKRVDGEVPAVLSWSLGE